MKYNNKPARLALLFLMSASAQAVAQMPTGVFIGGVQYSPESSYTYAGVLQAVPGAQLGEGLFYKAIASWLTYSYDTTRNGQDVTVRARAPGVEAGGGYAWKGDAYNLSLSGAVGYRNVRVRPFVPENEKTGSIWTFTPQLQASVRFHPRLEANTLASYAFGQKSAYGRARVAWKLNDDWFIGLQETYLKGRNYRINQHGIVIGRTFANGYAADISVGQSQPRDGGSSGYISLGLSRTF